MVYARAFFADESVVQQLLEAGGVQLEPTKIIISRLARLCAVLQIIDTLVQGHFAGEALPLRFEVALELPPITIMRSETIDVVQEFEDSNVLVPLRGNRFRVMLSNMMNTLFGLTGDSGEDSIRQAISRINNQGPFRIALDSVAWEIIKTVHENIDQKYLALDTLQKTLPPAILMDARNAAQSILDKINASGGFGDYFESEMARAAGKLRADSDLLESLQQYVMSVYDVSEAVKSEADRQWSIMRDIASYPRSFLARKKEPLVKSSWSLNPGFRSRPLMVKFQELIVENHSTLAHLADVYEDQISDVVSALSELPRCLDLLVVLRRRYPKLPSEQDFKSTWEQIDTQTQALLVQARLIESVVSSMDSLFAHHAEKE